MRIVVTAIKLELQPLHQARRQESLEMVADIVQRIRETKKTEITTTRIRLRGIPPRRYQALRTRYTTEA